MVIAESPRPILTIPTGGCPQSNLQDMQPGRYRMSIEDYHATNAIGKSDLDLLARSPAHFRQAKAAPVEPTSAMVFGSAFHVKVLQPEEFDDLVAVGAFKDRRTKAYAEWYAEHAGKIRILTDDYDAICRMYDAIQQHPVASALMTGGIGELSYFWRDPVTGVLCKCRPDYLRADGLIVDLKTCEDASPEGFAKAAARYRYHVQDAHYREGVKESEPECIPQLVFLAVEKEKPHPIGLYMPEPAFTIEGRTLRARDLSRYALCQQTGEWPGYQTGFQVLKLPAWAMNKGDYDNDSF